jgi:hypothetical protein
VKDKVDKKTSDLEDVYLWPDGFWCFNYELLDMSHKSDDFRIIPVNTPEWDRLTYLS